MDLAFEWGPLTPPGQPVRDCGAESDQSVSFRNSAMLLGVIVHFSRGGGPGNTTGLISRIYVALCCISI
jgi:hypothetical protein